MYCLYCAKEFIPNKYNPTSQKYCSYKCEQRHYGELHPDYVARARARTKKWYERHPNYEKERGKKRIRFGNKRLNVGVFIRNGICAICGSIKETVIHHYSYDEQHPLLDTIELCRACHARIHYDPKNLPTRPFEKGHPYYPRRWAHKVDSLEDGQLKVRWMSEEDAEDLDAIGAFDQKEQGIYVFPWISSFQKFTTVLHEFLHWAFWKLPTPIGERLDDLIDGEWP